MTIPAGPPPPPYGPPPWQVQPPPPDPRASRTRWLVGGIIATLVLTAVAVGLIWGAGKLFWKSPRSGDEPPPATAASNIPPPETVPSKQSVSTAGLENLLLNQQELVNLVPGSTGTSWQPVDQLRLPLPRRAVIDPPQCTSALSPGAASAYPMGSFTGFAWHFDISYASEMPGMIEQAVVGFDSAGKAAANRDQQLTDLQRCAGTTATEPDSRATVKFGTLDSANGILTMDYTKKAPKSESPDRCQRALTSVSNVVIDVSVCDTRSFGEGPKLMSARDVLDAIAAKIT